jgi:AMP phosphorylase
MKFQIKILPLRSEKLSVIMNPRDAEELGLKPGDRVKVSIGKELFVADADFAEIVKEGEIGVCSYTAQVCNLKGECLAEVYPISRPKSVEFIRKKLDGMKYSSYEIKSIISDISKNVLNDLEISAFILANEIVGLSDEELQWMIESMVENGERIIFSKGVIVDVHSVGGLPSNRFPLITVPTVASAGLLIPKTASRAITSASGTADTMEVLANVNLSVDEIKEITEKVGGVIAWGGATNIAPADDRIIKVEHPLSIDPRPQLLASVMAKKGAIGAKYVVIDIPFGEEAKIENAEGAKSLARDFIELGKRLGLNVACALTYGGQPIGRAIGPALEAKEALKAMEERRGSSSLLEKSLGIAGILFEMTGIANDGYSYAKKIFESGKTLEKFKEIIAAQGGDEKIRSDDIEVGDKIYTITSQRSGIVREMNLKTINEIARAAGAPKDKGAGVYVHRKRGEVVKAGDPLLTIYAEKEWKLDNAIEVAMLKRPIEVSGVVIEKFRGGV